jgi:hypothetical protein
MTFDSRSAAFQPADLVVNHASVPDVAALMPWHKYRSAAAMLVFAVGLLVAAVAAGADEAAQTVPTAARPVTGGARVQPTAKQVAPPNQPDISASDARTVDELYRQLIGPPPATRFGSRFGTPHLGGPRHASSSGLLE